jgi:hypothetical protein
MWTIVYGHHEDRTPTRGYDMATRAQMCRPKVGREVPEATDGRSHEGQLNVQRFSDTTGLLSAAPAFSPPHKPVDAAANQDHRKARAYERTWSAANVSAVAVAIALVALVVLSQRRNAQCQQQSHRNSKHELHDSFLLTLVLFLATLVDTGPTI